jgi:hypothetical protein
MHKYLSEISTIEKISDLNESPILLNANKQNSRTATNNELQIYGNCGSNGINARRSNSPRN